MNTIHCRVKQNEYQDIGKRHVTPAEAIVLRAIHDPAAHKYSNQASTPEERANFWKCIVNPVASGEAETIEHDGENREVGKHKRTQGEELQRLRAHYPTRSKTNSQVHIVDELFPGLNPNVPETFQEIGMIVAPPTAARPAATKGHGPALAEKTEDSSVVTYDKTPKGPKEPKEPKAPKTPKGPKEPKEPKAPKTPKGPKEPKEPKAGEVDADPSGE